MIDQDFLGIAETAYASYIRKNLPSIEPTVLPANFQEEAATAYASILKGELLPGYKKAGDLEAKIKMHIKTVSSAAQVLIDSRGKPENLEAEVFYSSPIRDVLYFHLGHLIRRRRTLNFHRFDTQFRGLVHARRSPS